MQITQNGTSPPQQQAVEQVENSLKASIDEGKIILEARQVQRVSIEWYEETLKNLGEQLKNQESNIKTLTKQLEEFDTEYILSQARQNWEKQKQHSEEGIKSLRDFIESLLTVRDKVDVLKQSEKSNSQ